MKLWKSLLVIYDIEDNKRRNKVVHLLESYGVRVQKSAFECYVDSARLNNMKSQLNKLVEDEDSIRIYSPSSKCYDVASSAEVELYRQGTLVI